MLRWLTGLVVLSILLVACQTATVLPDGRVLLIGGAEALIYDPAGGSLTSVPAPSVTRVRNT